MFDITPKSIDVPVGQSADLECHVTGAQPIHVTWAKDGREIRTGGNYAITFVANTAHLRILRVGKGDTGQYTCQASNDVGKDFCSAQLNVKGIGILGYNRTFLGTLFSSQFFVSKCLKLALNIFLSG